jgi:hypothetical protein
MKKQFSTKPLFYLGNPYSHKDKKVMLDRAEKVDRAAARLLKHNIMTYPPIALNSGWTDYEDFHHTWAFWESYDKNYLERCDGLLVLTLDGWKESVGLTSEIAYAKELGIPVVYVSYNDVMDGKIQHIYRAEKRIINKSKRKKSKQH